VLYTDGVIEARRERELYGEERLDALLGRNAKLAPEALAQAVLTRLVGQARLTGVTTQTTEISGRSGEGWMDGRWLPFPREGMVVAVLGHIVWVIGGSSSDSTSPTASVLRYVIPVVKVKLGGRAPP